MEVKESLSKIHHNTPVSNIMEAARWHEECSRADMSVWFFRHKDYSFLGGSFKAETVSSKVLNCFYGMGWLYRTIAVYLET